MEKYYLGINPDGEKVYLRKPEWACGWYWSFGGLESKNSWTHFDSEILEAGANSYERFKEYFKDTPLLDDEIWELLDYMQSYYTLSKTAELFHRGNSNFTERATLDTLKNNDLYITINNKLLPAVFEKIDNLFTHVGRKKKIEQVKKEYDAKIDKLLNDVAIKTTKFQREKNAKIKSIMAELED